MKANLLGCSSLAVVVVLVVGFVVVFPNHRGVRVLHIPLRSWQTRQTVSVGLDIPVTTIDHLVATYEVLLLDAYGVLVTGTTALPGAAELIAQLEGRGKPYFVLSNDASRLTETTARSYAERGVPIPAHRIINSGSLIADYFTENGLSGARCAVLGPPDSKLLVTRAGGVLVDPSETDEVDVVVIGDESGYPFLETVDNTLSMLYRRCERDTPTRLLLPNPDLVYPKAPGSFGIASGSIALLFETALALRYPNRAGLRFVRLGKPFAPIFEAAARRAGTRHMVMIGDQLGTDILGAHNFGIDSALIGTGLARISEADLHAAPPTYQLLNLDFTEGAQAR